MPRLLKAVLTVALSSFLLAVPSAQAQSTQTLLKRTKQALTPGGRPIEPTPLLRELAVRLPALHGSERRQAHALLLRPTEGENDPQGDGYTVPEAPPYCTEHYCVHWVATTGDAPSLADSNGNGIPDYVELVGATAENVHQVENGDLAWREPKSDGTHGGNVDKTDIYLKDLGGSGIYGYSVPDPDQQLADDHTAFGYIVIDNDFSASEFPGYASQTIPLEVTVAHEYNHILQFNYDVIQDTWMLESTAVWMEGMVYPAAFDYLQYLPGWVQLTQLPLTTFSSDPNDRNNVKVYGSAVWEKFLAAKYGPEVIRRAWEVSVDTNPASFAVAAFDRAIRDQAGGSDFPIQFTLFSAATAEWQATDSGFPEGSHYFFDVARAGSATVNGAGGSLRINHTTYSLLNIPHTTAARVKLGVIAPSGTSSGIALVGREGGVPGGTMSEVVNSMPGGGNGSVTIDNPSRFARLTAVVINSDSKLSGASNLTGDWIYSRDDQPYYARVSTDFTAPRVVRVSPKARTKRASRKTRIKVTFSERVRGVTGRSLQLIASNGRVVGAQVIFSNGSKTATLKPNKTLSRNRSYKVRVTTAVTDTSVNSLARTFTSWFRTATK
jgi:Big-like domain-containing protein